jgi:nitrite reductase/ring-hydroxylating ferredoxin subunit
MGIFKRIFGICETRPPASKDCWRYADGKVEIELQSAPELAGKGGAIRLEGGGLPDRILVIHGNDGEYHAFINRCTHARRRIDPLEGTSEIRCCSVSKSTFDYSGKVISGAAKNPLPVLSVEVQDSRLIVTLA